MRLCDNWDPSRWLRDFNEIRDFHRSRRAVFRATVEAGMSGYYLLDGKRIELPAAETITTGTRMYREEFVPTMRRQFPKMSIEVTPLDCLVTAKLLIEKNIGKVAVLNMANRQNPGGGVYGGAGAQEEYLFRCSNYFRSLYQFVDYAHQYNVPRNMLESYPMDRNYGGCYSPDVTVFRGTEEEGYPFIEKPWQCNFIAVAGIPLPDTEYVNGEDRLTAAMETGTRNKIRTVLNIAMDNDVDALVLGALGCGAFRNPPRHVAELFKEILAEERYCRSFKQVVFAIKPDHNSGKKNLCGIFKEVLEGE